MDGQVSPGTKIKIMSTGAVFDVVETGFFRASNFEQSKGLSAGEVGYIAASIKNVKDTRVGDTVTTAVNPTATPLPGYKKVNPMVFSGVYPADSTKYGDLRDALEKLKLNDASLTFEAENSIALGFGFRCGFLGLLHMEIIQERLEREYNLDLITTAPSVIYKIEKSGGETIFIDNPVNYPNPNDISKAYEPVVKADIIVPSEFVGNIMDLCQDRRGIFKNMEYIDTGRVCLKYELPLNEIIYDFFDALKSRTKGYAFRLRVLAMHSQTLLS
jgi:GTP-binding protein LepA